MPIPSTTKIDLSGMGKEEPSVEELLGLEEETPKKTTRKRTTKKKTSATTKRKGTNS
jgi:hypothetical protein